ncbi:MAG: hypothetical protein ABFS19_08345 [Thermodesulfobacteriota bacterium]
MSLHRNKLVTILLAAIFLSALPASGRAEEVTGQIETIDRARRTVVVKDVLIGSSGERHPSLTISLSESMWFKRPGGRYLPGCIKEGFPVRAWGNFETDGTTFHAERIRSGHYNPDDPTGVRERLGQSCGRGLHKQGNRKQSDGTFSRQSSGPGKIGQAERGRTGEQAGGKNRGKENGHGNGNGHGGGNGGGGRR